MISNECIAMILAGGRGERLGALTHYYSKPAVHFAGKRRIIDFTLNNCQNSGIKTIGILSQYLSNDLQAYVAYGRNLEDTGITMLPGKNGEDYVGTADAVYKNIDFIERAHPENVLVLAGDHIYDMDYRDMIAFHGSTGADITVASTPVPITEASRFGIIHADGDGRVRYFEEKPAYPTCNRASMGIYVFKWEKLKKYLLKDSTDSGTCHDFGRNILPDMLRAGESMYTYSFEHYWRDVGTVDSLWEANMDQINNAIYQPGDSVHIGGTPYCVGSDAIIHQSVVSEGGSIFGRVEHSVLCDFVTVYKGAEIVDCVIMPGAYIGANVKLYKTIVGPRAVIMDNAVIGAIDGTDFFVDNDICTRGVSLVAPWLSIKQGAFKPGSHIYKERLQEWAASEDELDEVAVRYPYLVKTETNYAYR